ncbi:phosphoribosylformylglycinamidine synthase subunit PurS [Clostridium sp. 'deep sea']|jgi:phosphoribosylformylglycinamidine synthase subunit PurS|uniref:phosphoribosylformylglycinamidine synthase subunit PurS n=1 Tax=Clostridium sp. 'deep sea' TaxID=2779445 RepID=UPI0018969B23|nr:phosphoribosylformylglycinamidine synthase subunit PurS [Clostridium sp. 'deep sea']QOR34766.1 phosphoribosylformylglycinamidine synthase subunit PurS [Clostridium sp. 'deep sea']
MFTARIFVTLKQGVLDAQGTAVKNSLHTMGYNTVTDIRVGKYLVVSLEAKDINVAKAKVNEMCDKLLANPVIEDYKIEFVGA